jgi:magnesium transporter
MTGNDASVCAESNTTAPARTRLYRDGELVEEGFPAAKISDYLADPAATVWLDLRGPDQHDLDLVAEEFQLDPLAVEDAAFRRERPKLDRYPTHLFLNTYATYLDDRTGQLSTSEVAAFITKQALITVRKDDRMPAADLLRTWDDSIDVAGGGVGFLLWGLLDHMVDLHFDAVQSLDDEIESLEDGLFDPRPRSAEVQRRSYQLRKSIVVLRRVALPMREVVNALMRHDLHVVSGDMAIYYQDLYDHVLRVTEWTDSLRDLVSTIIETSLTIQGNRLNEIMKKLTGWAAIIAVPTAVTGFFGQNVPYPGFQQASGFIASLVIMVAIAGLLYALFRRNHWL